MLNIIQLPVLENNYIYLVNEPESGATAVIDPAISGPVLELLAQKNWSLQLILNTHHHWDHIGANLELKQATGCKIAASAIDHDRIPAVDISLKEGDILTLGATTLEVIETPGHTLGHIVFYCKTSNALFCGDTLFAMGCGRLFEGSAEQLWQSLQKLKSLPEQTQIYCAHEYTQDNGRFALTVDPNNTLLQDRMIGINMQRAQKLPTIPFTLKAELETNPFLRTKCKSLQEKLQLLGQSELATFTKLRQLKDVFNG